MKKEEITYLLARLPMGMSFLGHGLVRLPKLTDFSQHMVQSFEKSMLPAGLVLPFSYVLPALELLTGIMILFGVFTRCGIVLGSLIILALIFGSSMIEQWPNVFMQIMYGGYLAVLYYFAQYNAWSVDGLRNRA